MDPTKTTKFDDTFSDLFKKTPSYNDLHVLKYVQFIEGESINKENSTFQNEDPLLDANYIITEIAKEIVRVRDKTF